MCHSLNEHLSNERARFSKETQLHVLFNNAYVFSEITVLHRLTDEYSGVMAVPLDRVTKQGYDSQFGTNVIGAFRIPDAFASTKHPLLLF